MEFDGVYKLRTLSDDAFTLMKTMGRGYHFVTNFKSLWIDPGLPEADIKLVMHPKNILTLTLMKNKDESITYMHELTMAPHMNFTITLKVKSKGLWSERVSFQIQLCASKHEFKKTNSLSLFRLGRLSS